MLLIAAMMQVKSAINEYIVAWCASAYMCVDISACSYMYSRKTYYFDRFQSVSCCATKTFSILKSTNCGRKRCTAATSRRCAVMRSSIRISTSTRSLKLSKATTSEWLRSRSGIIKPCKQRKILVLLPSLRYPRPGIMYFYERGIYCLI